MKIVAIEGCMGAGKSTTLDGLKSRLLRQPPPLSLAHVAQEPVEGWAHLLSDFYANPAGHSLVLQLAVLFSRIRQLVDILLKRDDDGTLITERSIDAGTHVFVPMLRAASLMTGDEEREYERRRHIMHSAAALLLASTSAFRSAGHQPAYAFSVEASESDAATGSTAAMVQEANRWQERLTRLHGVVYLEASPETCLRRVRARSRTGETNLTLEYLRDLQAAYGTWLAQLRARGVPVQTVSTEADGDEEAVIDAVCRGVRDCIHRPSNT